MNALVQNFAGALAKRVGKPFAVVLPHGMSHPAGSGAPLFTVVTRTDAALLALATRGYIGLLESYVDQPVDIEGDFGAAFATGLASGFDGGIKALCSDSIFTPSELAAAYRMDLYDDLKARYDPRHRLLGLYEKCALRA